MPSSNRLEFIAPAPRLGGDGATWVSDLRRLEDRGFDTVSVSHHLTNGWQLGPVAAMAYAAASTTRLRILSLVIQNPMQHPALLAKEIATIDRLSDGRAELGIGAGWLAGRRLRIPGSGLSIRRCPSGPVRRGTGRHLRLLPV